MEFTPAGRKKHAARPRAAPTRMGRKKAVPRTGRRSSYFAASRDDRGDQTARLAAVLRSAASRGLAWTYVARPDFTHATIFRGLAPAGLRSALR